MAPLVSTTVTSRLPTAWTHFARESAFRKMLSRPCSTRQVHSGGLHIQQALKMADRHRYQTRGPNQAGGLAARVQSMPEHCWSRALTQQRAGVQPALMGPASRGSQNGSSAAAGSCASVQQAQQLLVWVLLRARACPGHHHTCPLSLRATLPSALCQMLVTPCTLLVTVTGFPALSEWAKGRPCVQMESVMRPLWSIWSPGRSHLVRNCANRFAAWRCSSKDCGVAAGTLV